MKKRNGLRTFCFSLLVLLSCSTIAQKTSLEQKNISRIFKKDSVSFASFWDRFAQGILEKNYNQIKAMSLDSVYCESLGHIWKGLLQDRWVPRDTFIQVAFIENYNHHLADILRDSTYRIIARKISEWYPDSMIGHRRNSIVYRVSYIDYAPSKRGKFDKNYYAFDFIKLNGQFRFMALTLGWPSLIQTQD